MNDQMAVLKAEWEASLQREDLIKLLREKILPNDGVFVDAALFLGLGSMEKDLPPPGVETSSTVKSERE